MSNLPSHDTVMPVSYAVSLQHWLQNREPATLATPRLDARIACKAQREGSKEDAKLWDLSEGRVGGGGADVPSAMCYLERAPQAQPQLPFLNVGYEIRDLRDVGAYTDDWNIWLESCFDCLDALPWLHHVEHRCAIKASTASSECRTHVSIKSSTTQLFFPSVPERKQSTQVSERDRTREGGCMHISTRRCFFGACMCVN